MQVRVLISSDWSSIRNLSGRISSFTLLILQTACICKFDVSRVSTRPGVRRAVFTLFKNAYSAVKSLIFALTTEIMWYAGPNEILSP